MLLGKYKHTLDEKNRLIIPSKLRKTLGEDLILQPGFDTNVLILRSKSSFISYYNEINSLSNNNLNNRNLRRFLLSNTLELEMDKQGRITLPFEELKKANLNKEILIVGMGDYLEIWNSENFEIEIGKIAPKISELVQSVEEQKHSSFIISEINKNNKNGI